MKFAKLIAFLFSMLLLSACSQTEKTVQWEEEIPLNTGETIWVKRIDTFVSRSEPGNPLRMGWWPKQRQLKFSWEGREYAFQTETTAIMMIHVFHAPKAIAVIAWVKECGPPGYGEFRWINGSWQLQPTVSAALIGLPRNLMDYYSATDGDIPARVTQEFIRNSRFDLPHRGGTENHLMASRISSNCTKSK